MRLTLFSISFMTRWEAWKIKLCLRREKHLFFWCNTIYFCFVVCLQVIGNIIQFDLHRKSPPFLNIWGNLDINRRSLSLIIQGNTISARKKFIQMDNESIEKLSHDRCSSFTYFVFVVIGIYIHTSVCFFSHQEGQLKPGGCWAIYANNRVLGGSDKCIVLWEELMKTLYSNEQFSSN